MITYYFSEEGLLGCHPIASGPVTEGTCYMRVLQNQLRNFPDKAERLGNKPWSSYRGKWLRDQDLEITMGRRLFCFYWNAAWGVPYQAKWLGIRTGRSRHYGFM